MNQVVIDADVVSLIFRADSRAPLYDRHLSGRVAAVSFMTVAELDRWAYSLNHQGESSPHERPHQR